MLDPFLPTKPCSMERISNATAIFLVLISSSLSLLLFFCILHCWTQRRQPQEKEDSDHSPQELPVVPYSSNRFACLQECAVCLAELEEGEKVKVIPVCGHAFHPSCIDRWFASSCSCPLCRQSTQIPASSMV